MSSPLQQKSRIAKSQVSGDRSRDKNKNKGVLERGSMKAHG